MFKYQFLIDTDLVMLKKLPLGGWDVESWRPATASEQTTFTQKKVDATKHIGVHQ